MIGELVKIAGQCDGVRCDMAMLVLPEVFARTWGMSAQPFWLQATQRVRARVPDFCFMAEVYWTWSGRCSNRDSITRTTNGCTTACAMVTPGRCASISTPGSSTEQAGALSGKSRRAAGGGNVLSGSA